jgi:hypothetical protein
VASTSGTAAVRCRGASDEAGQRGCQLLPGFSQAATTLTDRIHRRKPRRLVLHYNSVPGSDAPAARGAPPTGLLATCALDGTIAFSAFYGGVPALGRSGLRLCSAGTLTTETILGLSGTSKLTPEDLAFGQDYLLAVYKGVSLQGAVGAGVRRQQAGTQVVVIDARKLVKGQKAGGGMRAPKPVSSPLRAYCLKETPVSNKESLVLQIWLGEIARFVLTPYVVLVTACPRRWAVSCRNATFASWLRRSSDRLRLP